MIELLVVVAVIALLVAILTPAIFRAQQIAQQAACSAHLGQFGAAFHLFAEDNDLLLPGKAGPVDWPMALTGTRIDPLTGCLANVATSYLPVDMTDPYMFDPALDCPASDNPAHSGRFSYGMAYSRFNWDSGVPCGGLRGPTRDRDRPLKITEIQRPSATPLLVEICQRRYEAYVISDGWKAQPQADNGYHNWGIFWDRHGKSMNVLFADRSVRPVSQSIWLDEQGSFPQPTYGPSGDTVLPLAHWFSATEFDRFGKPAWNVR